MKSAVPGRCINVPVATGLFLVLRWRSKPYGQCILVLQRRVEDTAAALARCTAAGTDTVKTFVSQRLGLLSCALEKKESLVSLVGGGYAIPTGSSRHWSDRETHVRTHEQGKRATWPCFPFAARTLLCANPVISASQVPPPKGPSSSIAAGGE